jgi:hypothetical protein
MRFVQKNIKFLDKFLIFNFQEAKLMYGALFSIKSFVNKISPIDPREGFLFYKTNKYALHYFETPSGLKFVLNTDVAATGVREFLQQLYSKVTYLFHYYNMTTIDPILQIWVDYVVRNPLWNPGTPVTSDLFKLKLDEFIKQSPMFGIKNV